jgi:hypothetical protein
LAIALSSCAFALSTAASAASTCAWLAAWAPGGAGRASLDIAGTAPGFENALVDLHTLAGQASEQEVAVTAARRALELSQQQYEKGAVSFLDVLDAERTLLQDERVSAQLLGARMQVTVQLIKALGGKWNS